MRSQITSVAVAALLAADFAVDARKHLVGANEERLRSPYVGEDYCEEKCVIGNSVDDKSHWCFVFSEPIVSIGWEYSQEANTDEEEDPLRNFRQDISFYVSAQLKITSYMDIYRLYLNEFMGEIPQFLTKYNLGFIVNERWQICPHIAYEIGTIEVNSTMRQEFMNCSKVILQNPWSIEGTYTGKYAKYFEECERSQADSSTGDDPQVTSTFISKELREATSESLLSGSFDPESQLYCWAPSFIPDYSQMGRPGAASMAFDFYRNLLTYYFNVVGPSKAKGGQWSF